MAQSDIQAILREFDPIRRAIAQPEGTDAIETSAIPGIPNAVDNDRDAILCFCAYANQMLVAENGFPDAQNYTWITEPQSYQNSFQAWCQGMIVNLLICLWEHRGFRCAKPVIARNIHTGSYHIETYETASAYFICISYQYLNLINRYSLLNHYLIEASSGTKQMTLATPTNEVAGQAIERAIRVKWSDICPHLDIFLMTVAKASNYQASEIFLNKHVTEAREQFYSSNRYAHLRDFRKMMGPYYLPPEAMWTVYSDQVMMFTLAHEIIHIMNDDTKKPSRSAAEEMGADMGATDLLAYITIPTARRRGYEPSNSIVVGPIVFFASRTCSPISRAQNLKIAPEDMKEQLMLVQRSIWVAQTLAAGRWLSDPSAALFWNVTSELRLLEIALRRRLWQLNGVPLLIPVDLEIAMEQDIMQSAKRRTEHDVTELWERSLKREDVPSK
jgi:hypothetical protein